MWFDFFLTSPYLSLDIAGRSDLETAAAGPAQRSEVVRQVSEQLIRLLDLSDCRLQHGKAGVRPAPPGSARLRHDGSVVVDRAGWPVDAKGLPAQDVELLVESGGYLRGRFLLTPAEGARPALENRLLAIALADQVGTVLVS